MVRSNFDYTNRTSSGEKLGSSIASDFWKKASQDVKIVKTTAKAGKPSRSKLNGQSAPEAARTRLDIKIPNKALTDGGFMLIADALVAALKARPDLVLAELDLSGNDLTARSLPGLADILAVAPELAALNLSNNNISVTTEEETAKMEAFSTNYWASAALVHLNLAHNEGLGGCAMEVLARAFSQVAPKVPADNNVRRDSHQDAHDAHGEYSDEADGSDQGANHAHAAASGKATRRRRKRPSEADRPLAVLEGTHATRLLDLKDTGLDEYGALFASAIMLPRHRDALQIMLDLKDNETTAGKDALLLLRIAEQCVASGMHQVKRSIIGVDPGHLNLEFERAVKKVQRNIVLKHGFSSVQLWNSGMAAFRISRQVFALCKDSNSADSAAITVGDSVSAVHLADTPKPQPTTSRALQASPSPLTARNLNTHARRSYADTTADTSPCVRRSDKATILTLEAYMGDTKLENRPRQGIQTALIPGEPVSARLNTMSDRNASPTHTKIKNADSRYTTWQRRHLQDLQHGHGGASNGYRDPSLRCQLPLPVCQLILHLSLDSLTLPRLSNRHQVKAFEWGQSHDGLATEYDWRSKDKASQIWMLLEAIDCLDYD